MLGVVKVKDNSFLQHLQSDYAYFYFFKYVYVKDYQ